MGSAQISHLSEDGEISIVDSLAFERGFEENFTAIYRFIARRVGSSLADDLAAETFATAFRRRASFEPDRGSLRPWLYGIAANLLRNHWRAEQHMLDIDARLRIETKMREDNSLSDDRVSASLLAPRIASALASLNADQREVILLHAWAELDHGEIAAALDIPLGTVRSRLSRARAALSAQLVGFDFDLWLFDEEPMSPAHEEIDRD